MQQGSRYRWPGLAWRATVALSLFLLCTACASGGSSEPTCGDGVTDSGESCDDGNQDMCDGCSATCQVEGCGNGILECAEECDDGNTGAGDGCAADCTLEPVPECGNGILETTEVCDDGNTLPCDGCTATCIDEACGNGVLDCGEGCDDGNTTDGDGCQADCSIEIPAGCGNGQMDAGEECDDGNNQSGDGCQSNCLLPACGDGVLDAGEVCDDGNTQNGDGCSDACTVEPYTHTIAIDGDNDFGSPDVFATSTLGFTGYVSWDASHLYLGLTGSDVASNDPNKWILVYLSGNPGSATGVTYNTQEAALPFSAGYHLRWKADGTYTDLQHFDGAWTSVTFNGDWDRSGSFVELALPLADLDAPNSLSLHMHMINEMNLGEWSWSSVPETSFADGYNPSLSRYYEFDLSSPDPPSSYAALP